MSNEKKCGECQGTFPGSSFHKCAASVDGLAARCKECQRIYDRARLNPKVSHFAQMKAAKMQRVQDSFIAARKGNGPFGIKN